jgi:hypothetical protein
MIYIILITLGITTRLLPHLPNFTSLGAIAIYSGFYLKNKKISLLIPLAIIFLTDLRIGTYQWQLMLFVYISYLIIGSIGILSKKLKWYIVAPLSIVGSLIFFIITNWSFWQFTLFYPHTLAGLTATYLAGLPFLKNTLTSDLIYAVSLFTITESINFLIKQKYANQTNLCSSRNTSNY